jgi:hypothetical protein
VWARDLLASASQPVPPSAPWESSLDAAGTYHGYHDGSYDTDTAEDLDEDEPVPLDLVAEVAKAERVSRV